MSRLGGDEGIRVSEAEKSRKRWRRALGLDGWKEVWMDGWMEGRNGGDGGDENKKERRGEEEEKKNTRAQANVASQSSRGRGVGME